jgi:Ca2+-binding RTX toxin-like protein
VNGRIDGGAGTDILDYSQFHAPATVNLQTASATATGGFAGVEGFVGSNTLLDTIVGKDASNSWQVYGNNNAGKINNSVQFSQFENWVGGTLDDTFRMASARYVSGAIDGGAGVNTLDYSLYTSGVAVNLSAGTATNVRGGVANLANVIGGAAADTLTGDAGDNLLLGNGGNDVLTAGGGRNVLFGGAGADALTGGVGEDILIGGTTSHDANAASLRAIQAEWRRTDLNYQQRTDHLTGAVGGGLNGSAYLKSSTVRDDATADRLVGLDGLDWFWGISVEVADRVTGERLN